MNWEVLAGDYDSGYEWQTRWSFAAADLSPAATRVEVIAEDIKGNESKRVVVRAMEILLVSGIWPPEVGGPASHAPEFGRFLVDRGHRVRAVTTIGSERPEDPGFPVLATRKDRPRWIRQPAAASALVRAARGSDMIYATGMYGRSALASTLTRTPLVIKLVTDPAYERARRLGLFSGTVEDFQRAPKRGRLGYLTRLRRIALQRPARIIVPSRYLAEIATTWGISRERMLVVPNGVPPVDQSVARDELRKRLGVRFPTFVFAGRLVPQKNLPLAIAAFSGVPGGSFVVIGDGVSRDERLTGQSRSVASVTGWM